MWWVLQPYRSFGESRVTIRRTEDTMKYIRGLPADSAQRATATALGSRGRRADGVARLRDVPLTICGVDPRRVRRRGDRDGAEEARPQPRLCK